VDSIPQVQGQDGVLNNFNVSFNNSFNSTCNLSEATIAARAGAVLEKGKQNSSLSEAVELDLALSKWLKHFDCEQTESINGYQMNNANARLKAYEETFFELIEKDLPFATLQLKIKKGYEEHMRVMKENED
jgi:hypothetical protein